MTDSISQPISKINIGLEVNSCTNFDVVLTMDPLEDISARLVMRNFLQTESAKSPVKGG